MRKNTKKNLHSPRFEALAANVDKEVALPFEEAIAKVKKQGLGKVRDYGPNAPQSIAQLLPMIQATRKRGFSMTEETYAHGLNAISAPVRLAEQPAIGILTIAGPHFRLTAKRMKDLGPELMACGSQLAASSGSSPYFNQLMRADNSHDGIGRKLIYME